MLNSKELEWIDFNANLIEGYPDTQKEIGASLGKQFGYGLSFNVLNLLIHYAKFGYSGFIIKHMDTSPYSFKVNVVLVGPTNIPLVNGEVYFNSDTTFGATPESKVRELVYRKLTNVLDLSKEVAKDLADHCELEDDLYTMGLVCNPTREVKNYNGN